VTDYTYVAVVVYPEHVFRHTFKTINLVDARAYCASTCRRPCCLHSL